MQSVHFGVAASPGRAPHQQRAKHRTGAVVVDALLRAGDVLLDIGAGDASIVLAAAARVGPLGHVHVFEAPEAVAQDAGDEIARRGLAQVTLHELALSQANGHALRFIAPLVGARPFGVRIDRADGQAGVLVSLAAFENLRFVVAASCSDGHPLFAQFSAADGWTVLGVRRSALRCTLERLDPGAPWRGPRDVVVVRRPATALPRSLHLPRLESLLDD